MISLPPILPELRQILPLRLHRRYQPGIRTLLALYESYEAVDCVNACLITVI